MMTERMMRIPTPSGGTVRTGLFLGLLLALAAPQAAEAQYFGRNKVQYDDFDFEVLETDHFDLHYYPVAAEAIEDFARKSERWYERLARLFQHEFEAKKPLIIYADHPDFQQTNTLQGAIGEGTGGVTESLKNRVIMPISGSYWDTDHVLGHELVHAFQYNIAQSRRGGGLQGLATLPLWLIEGMAEYLSVGRDDPHTAMWMRDAIRRDDFPTILQLTRDPRYFPYRYGQALWAYVGGTYGDDAIIDVFRRSLRIGFPGAIQQVLGVPIDTLSAQWRQSVADNYLPLMEGRTAPEDVGTLLVNDENGGSQNFSPAISPDGRSVAFLSEKDLFSIDLFIADAETGDIQRKLISSTTDPHGDALRYIDSSGSWSPDGSRFVFVVFADGDNQVVIIDSRNGKRIERIAFDELGAVANPAWSPDGRSLVFTGLKGGISDLYLYEFETEELTQLTNDKYADFHPTWSPDGRTIAFASDRGELTDFEELTFSKFQIATLDLETRGVRTLNLTGEGARHSNPQYGPDGRLYFLSDADGFADIYALDSDAGTLERLTRVATGVSGITYMSPAFSIAAQTGAIALSIFQEGGYTLHRIEPGARGEVVARIATGPVDPQAGPEGLIDPNARALPPFAADRYSRISEYLADAQTGLSMSGTFSTTQAEEYDPSLQLDFVGQPTLGVGADQFGGYIGGGASAFFSDMLGNQILGVALQAQGTVQDIGGQVFYGDQGSRWNWAVDLSRVPFIFQQQGFTRVPILDDQGNQIGEQGVLITRRIRQFLTRAIGQVSYPFSQTQRLEFRGGFQRIGFSVEEDQILLDQFNRVIAVDRVQRDDLAQPAQNFGVASVALVGDNSFFGFTSPIRGGRYRFQAEATTGTQDFLTLTADWRRYWAPHRYLTIAARGMHLGRYGTFDRNLIQDQFVGFEFFMRGYAFESFTDAECALSVAEGPTDVLDTGGAPSDCPVLDRLFGQRVGVINLEARVPFLGVPQFGVINFPFAPTELVAFVDAGLAWDADQSPTFEWSRGTTQRVPVVSTGLSARTNLLGIFILESYFAYPFQRPGRGWHWGFSLLPGW